MSNYSGKGFNSSSSVTENKFPPFAELIGEYCDRNPKERTKFICPACGGGNLSVNMKTGKWDCMSEQSAEHRQEICEKLNGLYKAEHPELSSGRNVGKPKTARQEFAAKAKAAEFDAEMGRSAVEMKVEELAHQFDPSSKRGTLAALTVEIAAWAKAGGHDVFGAKMMLKEAIERVAANTVSSGNGNVSNSGNGSNPYSPRDVSIVNGVSSSIDISELLASVKEVRDLELAGGDSLDPYKLFPEKLASALVRAAKVLPCPVEALVTALLAIASRLIGTSSVISPKNGWSEPLVFWGLISAVTGSMKSTTLSVITKPLVKLQAQAEFDYAKALEQWNLDKDTAKKNEEEFENPEPQKVEYFIDDATFEAVGQTHKENQRGVLVMMDEGDSWFAGMNKHRGGKGDDAQRWLSLNSGSQIKVNRLSRRLFVEKTCAAIIGTIQPETMIPILRDPKSNTSGMNSRWNFCNKPFPSALSGVEDDGAVEDLQVLLLQLYKRLLLLPGGDFDDDGHLQQTEYMFHKDAYVFWHERWMPYIVPISEKEQHQGFRGVLAKQRGFAARNAGLLYLIGNAVNGNKEPSKFIPMEQVQGGVAIAQFFINQAKNLYGLAGIESQDQDWTPILMRLKDASTKAADTNGWITPRDAKRKTRLVTSSDHAKSIFAQLFEAGIGELDTSNNTPRWRWISELNSAKGDAVDIVANADKLTNDWLSGVAANVASSVDNVATADNPEEVKTSSTLKETPILPIEVGDQVTITQGDYKNSYPIVIEVKEVSGLTIYSLSMRYNDDGTPNPLDFDIKLPESHIKPYSPLDRKSPFA